jgi:hypothetical protein
VKDAVYPYDKGLFSRLFLNCYQRQSMVMLTQRTPAAHHLFHRCLISTDEILRQVVKQRHPKYDFESGFFQPDDLRRIGIVPHDVPFESYAEARPLLREVVEREGYAILVGDVYYWPHCPEYRTKHLTHTITLTRYDAEAREWSLIDDNPASLLCTYAYPEQVIADSFDNGELRRIRYFTLEEVSREEAEHGTREAFARLVEEYRDTHTLLTGVSEILHCPWAASEVSVAALHDAFSLYLGSRTGLLEYARHLIGDTEVHDVIDRLVKQATEVQNQLLLGKVTGTVDTQWMSSTCLELRTGEEELLRRLKHVAVVRGTS